MTDATDATRSPEIERVKRLSLIRTHPRTVQPGFGPENGQAYQGAKLGWARMLDTLSGLLAQA